MFDPNAKYHRRSSSEVLSSLTSCTLIGTPDLPGGSWSKLVLQQHRQDITVLQMFYRHLPMHTHEGRCNSTNITDQGRCIQASQDLDSSAVTLSHGLDWPNTHCRPSTPDTYRRHITSRPADKEKLSFELLVSNTDGLQGCRQNREGVQQQSACCSPPERNDERTLLIRHRAAQPDYWLGLHCKVITYDVDQIDSLRNH